MNCEKAGRILVDYSEGLLREGKRHAVEEHLSGCEACKGELAQIEKLKERVLSLESPKRDTEFWRCFDNKLSQRLNDEKSVATDLGFRRRATLPFVAAAAVAALAVVSLLIFGRQDFTPAPDPQVAGDVTVDNTVDSVVLEMDAFDDDILIDVLLAQADSFDGDIEQEAEDMFLLVEEDFRAVPDEVIIYRIYEPTIDDFLDDLSAEEFDEIYQELASI